MLLDDTCRRSCCRASDLHQERQISLHAVDDLLVLVLDVGLSPSSSQAHSTPRLAREVLDLDLLTDQHVHAYLHHIDVQDDELVCLHLLRGRAARLLSIFMTSFSFNSSSSHQLRVQLLHVARLKLHVDELVLLIALIHVDGLVFVLMASPPFSPLSPLSEQITFSSTIFARASRDQRVRWLHTVALLVDPDVDGKLVHNEVDTLLSVHHVPFWSSTISDVKRHPPRYCGTGLM